MPRKQWKGKHAFCNPQVYVIVQPRLRRTSIDLPLLGLVQYSGLFFRLLKPEIMRQIQNPARIVILDKQFSIAASRAKIKLTFCSLVNAKQLFAVDKDQDSKVVSRQLAEIVYPLLFALDNVLHSFSSVELNYQEDFKASKKLAKQWQNWTLICFKYLGIHCKSEEHERHLGSQRFIKYSL